MMSKHDPTAVTINELQAAGIEPTEVKQSGGGHHKIYFDSQRQTPLHCVCAIAQAIGEPNGTIAVS